jgi:hypothetical protein
MKERREGRGAEAEGRRTGKQLNTSTEKNGRKGGAIIFFPTVEFCLIILAFGLVGDFACQLITRFV